MIPRSPALLATCLWVCSSLAAYAAEPSIRLVDCDIAGSQDIGRIKARCGTLLRPENPDDPTGPTVDLKIAVIASLSPEPKPDAFTPINGGPGGSSIEMYVDGAHAFTGIHRERDIVIVDQRGTGGSNPLDCSELQSLNTGFVAELLEGAIDQCLAELPGDPRFYTTSVAVQDLEAVRRALGYEQLNLYGVSYGTRVAQHYARRYPESVRTLIIDGVLPPDLALGPSVAINAQITLDRLFERCASDPACAQAFPRIDEKFESLKTSLAEAPVTVTLPHPITGERQTIDISVEHLVVTVRMLSYAPETASLIPLIIEQAHTRENYTPIAANAIRIITSLKSALKIGMHNAVVCAEDVPYLGTVDYAELEATYMGTEQTRTLETLCRRWPRGIVDEDLHTMLDLTIPTLILSGEEDPITPPKYGEAVAASLKNSLHLVGPGQGHGIFNRGCVPGLMTRFVENGDWRELSTTCISRLRHQPFFLNSMGPQP